MTDLRTAAQQALEALEAVYGDSCDAIHGLRAALAQPEPAAPTVVEPCGWACFKDGVLQTELVGTKADVDFWCASDEPHMQGMVAGPVFATPPRAVQKPSESLEALRVMLQEAVDRLLATPPRAPLSDEQIDDCLPLGMAPHSTLVGPDEIRKFARAVIAASGGPRNE